MSKITITPRNRKGGFFFTAAYLDKESGRNKHLIKRPDNTFVVVTNVGSDQKVFSHNFTMGQSLTIQVDLGTSDGKEVAKFFRGHPHLLCVGHKNPNSVQVLADVVVGDDKVNAEFDDLMERLGIASDVLTMDLEEKEALCWALQIDPHEMSEKEILVTLLGPQLNGAAIANRGAAIAYGKLVEKEKVATLYANKAVRNNIASLENGVYMIAGTNCGSSIQTIVNVLLSNDDMYRNYVIPEIDKIEREKRKRVTRTVIADGEIPETLKEILPATTGKGKSKKTAPES